MTTTSTGGAWTLSKTISAKKPPIETLYPESRQGVQTRVEHTRRKQMRLEP